MPPSPQGTSSQTSPPRHPAVLLGLTLLATCALGCLPPTPTPLGKRHPHRHCHDAATSSKEPAPRCHHHHHGPGHHGP